ncbi:MAG TPA: MBL fold metallo-hydrolase [Trueperaceae bacterium]|nr:MBL fold metallo-hydrolase [Trueperaceae bacterium]
MKLTCAGAARTVTGSCHHLATSSANLLVDCGLFQGPSALRVRNYEPFPFAADELDSVLLTHGHLDHVGRLPRLFKQGYRGTVYCTQGTSEIAEIILRDSAKIQQEDFERDLRKAKRSGRESEVEDPLYTLEDAERAIASFEVVPFDKRVEVASGVAVTCRPAGHILGSAYLEVEADGARIVFSGDLGNRGSALHFPAEPPSGCDIMLLETTYADRKHRSRESTEAEFEQVVRTALKRGGNVMIPTFAVERAQQVLYELYRAIHERDLPQPRIFVDSPMATRVTRQYEAGIEELRPEVAEVFAHGEDPFFPPGLEYTVKAEDSRKINDIHGGAIIIASSGMMTGGRILHHLKHNLWRNEASLIIVGYQAEGTLGRALLNGARRVHIYGDEIAVRASIHTINGFSAHADKDDLLAFAKPSSDAHLILVHGEEDVMTGFAKELRAAGRRVDCPELDVPLDL